MFWYCIFVTLVLGMLMGSVITVLVAIRHEDKMRARRAIHPSTRVGPNPFITPSE